MGTQSTAKTIFLLLSVVGWLGVGATLIYLSPYWINLATHSETTERWMETLALSGYSPAWGMQTGGAVFALTVIGNIVWYQKFEGKV